MEAPQASNIVSVVGVRKPRSRSRGSIGSSVEFVYVNQDGSVREPSPAEQAYLSDEFSGGDSGRPYVKERYESRDGWGSLSGFIERRNVPADIAVSPVHPDFDAREAELGFDPLDPHRAAGDIIETRADGSTSCTPNPQISGARRFALMRDWHLAHQRARERLAMVHHTSDEQGA